MLAYAQADFRATDQALLERLVEIFGESLVDGPGPRLVVLGCRPGNNSFRLAERFPQASVLGLDGSADMVQIAEQELAVRESGNRVVDWLHFDQVHLGPESLPYGSEGGGEQQPVAPSPGPPCPLVAPAATGGHGGCKLHQSHAPQFCDYFPPRRR